MDTFWIKFFISVLFSFASVGLCTVIVLIVQAVAPHIPHKIEIKHEDMSLDSRCTYSFEHFMNLAEEINENTSMRVRFVMKENALFMIAIDDSGDPWVYNFNTHVWNQYRSLTVREWK